jgi:hypothetical protein
MICLNVSLHSECLPRACRSIYYYIAVLALIELVTELFSTIGENLVLCYASVEHIFKKELSFPVVEVVVSLHFDAFLILAGSKYFLVILLYSD